MENLSQNEQIRQHLEAGNTITPLEALSLFGCLRLGARIHNLKAAGMAICSRLIESNGKRFAEYSLAKLLVVALIVFSGCTTLKPGCRHQRHAVKMSQMDTQYSRCTSANDDWSRVYRNWEKRPSKKTRIPLTQIYMR